MKPRIRVLTLGVSDLERATAFYSKGLGLPLRGVAGNDEDETTVAFFDLENDLILALYPQAWLSKDAGLAPPGGDVARTFTIGHLTTSKRQVDAIMEQARRAGATITAAPVQRPWGGYSGFFQDPDRHVWEIIWNPEYPQG